MIAQHIASRQVADAVLFLESRRLRTFAGAGRTEEDESKAGCWGSGIAAEPESVAGGSRRLFQLGFSSGCMTLSVCPLPGRDSSRTSASLGLLLEVLDLLVQLGACQVVTKHRELKQRRTCCESFLR